MLATASLFTLTLDACLKSDCKWSIPHDCANAVEGIADASGIPSWILRTALGEAIAVKCLKDAADAAQYYCAQNTTAKFLNVKRTKTRNGSERPCSEALSIATPILKIVEDYLSRGQYRLGSDPVEPFHVSLARFLDQERVINVRLSDCYSPDFIECLREYCADAEKRSVTA